MIRVLLADDHPVVLEGAKLCIESQDDMEVVGRCRTGWRAVELAGELRPDVVVMDVMLPDLNGILATRRVLAASKETAVVALTAHVNHELVADMLAAGAAGYVSKSCSAEEVIAAIRQAAAGGKYFCDVVSPMAGVARGNGRRSRRPAIIPLLSTRENEVLQLVAEGGSTKNIAVRLGLSPHTVTRHRARIMNKLGVRTIAELTRCAIREGLSPLT